jgi:Uma2 family endonuclease
MATHLRVPVEEYLSTSYSPDPDYVDGELRQRNVGEYPHSKVQRRLIAFFERLAANHPLHPAPELRLKLGAARYRVADLAVFAGEEPSENVPSRPPLAVIEILSREDRWVDVLEKLEDYRQWGVDHIWLADPWSRRLMVYSGDGLRPAEAFEIPELGAKLAAGEIFR